ncbi:EF-HAND CALCIUM-BINDING DOMAIN CONTAINING PROTEIN [Salix koriyanagi]|uniref:EF-HAND CALCIUM-BINDING DOMAIN CONTAINING PROTEIN n=1 Tax=Salix koriyanagi TaxID=2511006 RepID=A0A9Q1AMV4_9ROSI|nr:EF-HAND CALCIUM-BINDING DOMAIN CONTAINING PROTEIN [Salix koriyanagi]
MSKWQQYERVFSHFDENGDGRISPSELQQCVRKMGGELSAMDAETTIKFLDLDEDGAVKLEDFVKFVEGGEEEERERDLKEAFKMYEMEESCCITPKSLKRMLSRLGAEASGRYWTSLRSNHEAEPASNSSVRISKHL